MGRFYFHFAALLYLLNPGDLVQGCSSDDPFYKKYPGHTMCLPPKKCSENKELLKSDTLDKMERMAVLDIHNKLRQMVANGRVYGQPPAKNMKQLTWDDGLAVVAQRWAEQCTFKHDTQRRDARFYVGQNLAFEWHFPPQKDRSAPIISSTVAMFNEVQDPGFPPSQIHPFRSKSGVGHYTQIAWANTSLMGCGHAVYAESRKTSRGNERGETKLLVCNFGPGGNMGGDKMYEVGRPDCPINSISYPGLCTTNEINRSFDPPCENDKFKEVFAILCDETRFFKELKIKGIMIDGDSSGLPVWISVLLILILAACLCGAGFVVHRLCQKGTLPPLPPLPQAVRNLHLPNAFKAVKIRGPWKG